MSSKGTFLLAALASTVLSQATPWPIINTWKNYRLDLTAFEWDGNETLAPVADTSHIVLMNSDLGRVRILSQYRYQMFGVIESDFVLDFNKSIETG